MSGREEHEAAAGAGEAGTTQTAERGEGTTPNVGPSPTALQQAIERVELVYDAFQYDDALRVVLDAARAWQAAGEFARSLGGTPVYDETVSHQWPRASTEQEGTNDAR